MSPVSALNKVLDAEHAAVYAYGVVGARTAASQRAAATAGFNAHRARRDQLRGLITTRSGTPSEAAPGYTLPFPIVTSTDAARLAAYIEDRVTSAYLELTSTEDPDLRRLAAHAMQECTIRAYTWRPTIAALPGWPATPTPSSARPSTSPPVSLNQ
ncbi:ferritin-like domain-containing protein [Sphaerisporangium sp. B11E5]|uniref:ferritin-like domain-containing protein n=1 Tax=Sphaerisporangium sp. B11E5 TaxID=3153563 RepID=UPI00325F8C43